MIRIFKNNIKKIIFLGFSLLFLVLALCVNWNDANFFNIIYLPLKSIGDYIRSLGNTVGGWLLYIFLGILPLAFPIYKIIRTRKIYIFGIAWITLCVFDYVMLYFYINPHLLGSVIVSGTDKLNEIALIGFEVTFFILLFICALIEVCLSMKYRHEKYYFLAEIIIDILIFIIIFNVCFTTVLNAKSQIADINTAHLSEINFNKGLNVFAVVFSLLIKCVPPAVTVFLLFKRCDFIDKLKNNAFSPKNIGYLKEITRFAKLTVLITLTATAVNNIFNITLSKWILNANYSFEVPIVLLLTVCLVVIFSEILIGAIKISEEQKLVI